MSTHDAIPQPLRRAAIYRLCATTFGYPTPDRLAVVADLAERVAATARDPLAALALALARAARSADDADVTSEYVALFDGAARCLPYEGGYGPPQLAGKSGQLADIAGFYAAFGLTPSDGQPEVEDHVGTELEFMSALAIKEAWALAEGHFERAEIAADATVAFVRDHLGCWAPSFAAALRTTTAHPYYRAAGELLEMWLAVDAGSLGVELSSSVPARPDPEAHESFACPHVS
jgi:putative dimethyl sulfoxide reductase chaperone